MTLNLKRIIMTPKVMTDELSVTKSYADHNDEAICQMIFVTKHEVDYNDAECNDRSIFCH